MEYSLQDLVTLGTMLVTMALGYARIKSEIRHLDDTKAERRELESLSMELRGILTEIKTSIVRLEEALKTTGEM